MATPEQENQIAALYIGYFDRASDPDGLQFWIDQIDAGRDFATIAADFAKSEEAQLLYPFLVDPALADPVDFVRSVYKNLFDRAPDTAGLAFWTKVIADKTVPVGDMIESIIIGAVDSPLGQLPTYDATILTNKTTVALEFAAKTASITGFVYDNAAATVAKSIMDGITNDPSTVSVAKQSIAELLDHIISKVIINLDGNRSDYKIEASTSGFVISQEGQSDLFHKGGTIHFSDGGVYLLRDTSAIIASATSHLENYDGFDALSSNVEWFHTGAWWNGPHDTNIFENPEAILQFPSRGENSVTTAYINIAEISGVGGWDPHWNSAWDLDGDNIIDVEESSLPSYLQGLTLNEYWGNYFVNYWEEGWKDTLFEKIDIVMAQNFDGVMFDVTTAWSHKIDKNPNALSDMATLMTEVSSYIHSNYGNTALATFNIGNAVLKEHPELAGVIDAAYYQNSYLNWNGDGEISPYVEYERFVALSNLFNSNGKTLFAMDHLDVQDEETLLSYLKNSIDTGVTPMISSHLFENFIDYPIYRFVNSDRKEISGWERKDIFFSDVDGAVLSGEGGSDTFSFSAGSAKNMITDFNPQDDRVIFFNSDLEVLGAADVEKIQSSDGTLELVSSTGASVILENLTINDPIDIYSGVFI